MNRFFTRAAVALAGAVSLLALPTMVLDAHAATSSAPVTCHSNDIIEGTHGSVTIPPGNYCLIFRATINGNVTARSGAIQLGIDDSKITGTVTSAGITDNGWICGSTIGQAVNIHNSANNPDTESSPGQWDIGFADPNYCGNTSFDPHPGNNIGGTLSFNNNFSGAAIANNTIGSALRCSGNNPPPTGGDNHVGGRATGQCKTLAS
jgi:hypothetical protein